MANVAVMASGNGTNFQAIAERVRATHHQVVGLVVDRPTAYAKTRAEALGVPSHVVSYAGRSRHSVEDEILEILAKWGAHLVALAGFMRILSPHFLQRFDGPIVNVHPALLPRHPGAHGIADSYRSRDTTLGVTVHYVDAGVDTGPIIAQEAFQRTGDESLTAIEARIHRIEHRLYPRVVLEILDKLPHRLEATT
jgi:phosphoribosylglycinamide formyltransferase-1